METIGVDIHCTCPNSREAYVKALGRGNRLCVRSMRWIKVGSRLGGCFEVSIFGSDELGGEDEGTHLSISFDDAKALAEFLTGSLPDYNTETKG